MSCSVLSCEPGVPKFRSIPRSSRDSPAHLFFTERNSLLCLARMSLLPSFRASFAARLLWPLLIFPARGRVGRDFSERISKFDSLHGWDCAGHRLPRQSLQDPGGGNCANSRPASRRLPVHGCDSSREKVEYGEIW